MDWYIFLVVAHIIGTVLGAGGATFAEINLVRALRDGEISPDENALMQGVYFVLRSGFFILVISGFGFLLYYRLLGTEEMLYSQALWAKLVVIGILSANAVLIQLHWVPLVLGSAITITSWYTVLTLGVLVRYVEFSYTTVFSIYAFVIVIMYFILQFVHKKFVQHKEL